MPFELSTRPVSIHVSEYDDADNYDSEIISSPAKYEEFLEKHVFAMT